MINRFRMHNWCDVSEMLGKTLISIEGMENGNDEVYFNCSDGSKYFMYHEQDCCESVSIEDVCGNVEDLTGSPLLMSEETNIESGESIAGSCTSTWYKFGTIKGYVTVRWHGESNGCYSEEVNFERVM